jgi:hypothetical protein
VDLKPGKNCRIYSMGRKRYCQLLEASLADAGTYHCDAGDISTSCCLEVYGRQGGVRGLVWVEVSFGSMT